MNTLPSRGQTTSQPEGILSRFGSFLGHSSSVTKTINKPKGKPYVPGNRPKSGVSAKPEAMSIVGFMNVVIDRVRLSIQGNRLTEAERKRKYEEKMVEYNKKHQRTLEDHGFLDKERIKQKPAWEYLGDCLKSKIKTYSWKGKEFGLRMWSGNLSEEQAVVFKKMSYEKDDQGRNEVVFEFENHESLRFNMERGDILKSVHERIMRLPDVPKDESQFTPEELDEQARQQEYSWNTLRNALLVVDDLSGNIYFRWDDEPVIFMNGAVKELKRIYHQAGYIVIEFHDATKISHDLDGTTTGTLEYQQKIDEFITTKLRKYIKTLPIHSSDVKYLKEHPVEKNTTPSLPVEQIVTPVGSKVEISPVVLTEQDIDAQFARMAENDEINARLEEIFGPGNEGLPLSDEASVVGTTNISPESSGVDKRINKGNRTRNIALAALVVGGVGLGYNYLSTGKKGDVQKAPAPQVQVDMTPKTPKIISSSNLAPEVQKSLDIIKPALVVQLNKVDNSIWRVLKKQGKIRLAWDKNGVFHGENIAVVMKDGKIKSPVTLEMAKKIWSNQYVAICDNPIDQKTISSDRRHKATFNLESSYKNTIEENALTEEDARHLASITSVVDEVKGKEAQILYQISSRKEDEISPIIIKEEKKVQEILDTPKSIVASDIRGVSTQVEGILSPSEVRPQNPYAKIELDIRPAYTGKPIDSSVIQSQSESRQFLQDLIKNKKEGREWMDKKILLSQGGKELIFEKLVYAGNIARIKVHEANDMRRSFYIPADSVFQSLPAAPIVHDKNMDQFSAFADRLQKLTENRLVPKGNLWGKMLSGVKKLFA